MEQRTKKKHVCILVDFLTKGGTEKAASLLSKAFFDANYKVSIISMQEGIDYDYKGQLYNLGKIKHRIGLIKSVKKILQLKKTYNSLNADVYIDFRYRGSYIKEFILNLFVFNIKKTVLAVRSYKIEKYIPQSDYFYQLYNQSKAITVVSKQILNKTKNLYGFKNLVYIPNFIYDDIYTKSQQDEIELKEPFILAIGRLENEVKQFDKLILAYKDSVPREKGVPLIILGKGKDKHNLEKLITEHKLEKIVKLLGFKNNPYPYIKASTFLLLSSKFEGFPNVLIESLALGTPIISFDCQSGPSEMIQDQQNGILVLNQDFKAFTKAIDKMFTNKEFYQICKNNSQISVKKYSKDIVFKEWEELIKN